MAPKIKYFLSLLAVFTAASVLMAARSGTRQFFRSVSSPLRDEAIQTHVANLGQMAQTTRQYLGSLEKADHDKLYAKASVTGLTPKRIQETLRELETVLKNDGVLTTTNLTKHFKFLKWDGDTMTAAQNGCVVPSGKIRLTQYLVFETRGSERKTQQYTCALYGVPGDEAGMTQETIEKNQDKLIRYRYTKQDAVDGALDKHRDVVKPIVWLTRNDLEEALMQGTISVTMPSGEKKAFNVDRNNGIPYEKTQKDRMAQKRYWYFRELTGIMGYEAQPGNKVPILPEVAFAGDVEHLGLGSLIAIRYEHPNTKKVEVRLGVLADTGGAFAANLYQLDYFAGTFPSRDKFNEFARGLPPYVEAYILVKK